MFGHQDDDKDHEKKDQPAEGSPADGQVAAPDDQSAMAPGDDAATPADASDDSGHADGPVDDDHAWQHSGESSDGAGKDHGKKDAPDTPAEPEEPKETEDSDEPEEPAPHEDQPGPISDVIAPAGSGSAQNPVPPMPINARDLPDDDAKTPHELIEIKQKALNELQPLLGQLDQSPEDKFRTLMMIIQASDNQDMVKQAYDVAENIKDEKVRAQALLDIVNEINYFTQHPG